jgi:hypothetical protein
MCNWSDDERRKRAANIGAASLGQLSDEVVPLCRRILEVSADEGIPSPGTLDKVVLACVGNPSRVREYVYAFMETASRAARSKPDFFDGVDGEEAFWRLCHLPRYRELLHNADAFFAVLLGGELIIPNGGFASIAAAPGIDRIETEVSSAINGDACAAGLLLIAIAVLHKHHPEMSASLNRAVFILSSRKVMGDRARTERSLIGAWKKWRAVAPLWAGVIVASGGWSQQQIMGMLLSDEELRQAIAVAKWFASFGTRHKPDRAARPIIPNHEVMEFPADLEEEEPNLLPLKGAWLDEARSYRAPVPAEHDRATAIPDRAPASR